MDIAWRSWRRNILITVRTLTHIHTIVSSSLVFLCPSNDLRKKRCGAQFTSKLEGMITDLSLAADIQKSFREHMDNIQAKESLAGMDFSVGRPFPRVREV